MRVALGVGLLLASTVLSGGAAAQEWPGIYTDQASYPAGGTISIHASSPAAGTSLMFRLVRQGLPWTEVARTAAISTGPQPTRLGSFVEVPGLDLAGRTAFTLEGWWYPTLVGGDTLLVAGQGSATHAAAGIIITQDGRPAAYVSSTAPLQPARLASATTALRTHVWHHLAATYDSAAATLALYVDGQLAASLATSGAVASTGLPFRLGARAEAPGELTGVIDGTLDSWVVWPTALTAAQVAARRDRGTTEANPAPAPADVLFYAGFEDPYGDVVSDASAAPHHGHVVNHGTPRIAGRTGASRALRLNHDQLVDAAWPVTATLVIPPNAAPGLYAVHALVGPAFDVSNPAAETLATLVVRPLSPTPNTRLAVVVPVDTWSTYNNWPATLPGITPRASLGGTPLCCGGNNSAYGPMGDGVSYAFFQGWHRPNPNASVVRRDVRGFSHLSSLTQDLQAWLDAEGVTFDAYANSDLEDGMVALSAYTTVLTHGHHEYWTQGELTELTLFLAQGGSVLNLSGNTLTYRVARGSKQVTEARKWPTYNVGYGEGDQRSAVDGQRLGYWRVLQICSGGGGQDFLLGTTSNVGTPACEPTLDGGVCFGQWSAQEPTHWLWGDGGVAAGLVFGGQVVGHEYDTFVADHLPPGLAAGTSPTVLARGVGYGGPISLVDYAAMDRASCEDFNNADAGLRERLLVDAGTGPAGDIVYYRHAAGGRVLSIPSPATTLALGVDPVMTALILRALRCFSGEDRCGDNVVAALDAGTPPPDANIIPDAATTLDGATTPEADASIIPDAASALDGATAPAADAAATPPGTADESNCHCGNTHVAWPAWWLGLLGGLGWWAGAPVRRRRG